MEQIKVIEEGDRELFEKRVNSFLKKTDMEELIDIKYQRGINGWSAMIIYY